MMLGMVLFWALVLAALAVGVWWLAGQWRPQPRDTALDVLRERYARGEISRDEFEARRPPGCSDRWIVAGIR